MRSAIRALRIGCGLGLVACRASTEGSATTELARSTPAASSGLMGLADAGAPPSAACDAGLCSGDGSLGCAGAELLRPAASAMSTSFVRSGSTSGSPSTRQSRLGSCAGEVAVPAVWYRLDLQALPRAVELRALLTADFDAALELRQGACGDTLSLDCDRASALGKPGSLLTRRLEPGAYWLVVAGATPSSEGAFVLQLDLDPELGDCESPPEHRQCAAARPLEALPAQTLLLDFACAPFMAEDRVEKLYYSLDLSQEPAPVLASASLWLLHDERFVSRLQWFGPEPAAPSCATELTRSEVPAGRGFAVAAEASALLSPGRYVLAAELDVTELKDPRAQLSVQLDRASCPSVSSRSVSSSSVSNGSAPSGGAPGGAARCAAALELDSSASVQLLEGSTLCNQNQLDSDCSEGAPEQLYRLDLRAAAGETRVRAAILADGTDFAPVLYLVSATEEGDCGEVSYCPDTLAQAQNLPQLDLMLRPGLYFIGVDGLELGGAGRYRGLLELSEARPSACISAPIAACAFADATLDCCYDSGPRCDRVLELCGLAPATRACVCASNPACCGPEWRAADCVEAHRSCQYLCPEFSVSEGRCY